MLTWVFIAASLALVMIVLLAPLAVLRPLSSEIDDAAFYRGQIGEIERDEARGLLDTVSAGEARIEAARRLIGTRDGAADAGTSMDPAVLLRRKRMASVAILVGIPAIALALYAGRGAPDMPDAPHAARAVSPVDPTDMAGMVSRVEARLATHPEDGAGWSAVAPVYVSLGRYEDAVKAYSEAIRLNGETADLRSGLGEARMAAAEGMVTALALAEFTRALTLDPMNDRATYYRAIAYEQDGDRTRALVLYRTMLTRLAPDADSVQIVRARIAAIEAQDLKADASVGQDQAAMIRSMVERLDTRLSADGSDIEGWVRLMRAYQVLGEKDKATDALKRARAAQQGRAEAMSRLGEAAHELGIEN